MAAARPPGCNANTDTDCTPSCGNGVVEPGETCDGNCPTSCGDSNACTTDALHGSAAQCNAVCTHVAITACAADGCCAPGCYNSDDADCAQHAQGATEACGVATDCASNYCIPENMGFPGGFCYAQCTADAQCGPGNICEFLQQNGMGACVHACTTTSDCRAGYSCGDRDGDMRDECMP